MNFREDFSDALRSLIIEHYQDQVEASGFELEDFVDRALVIVEDTSELLCDTILEFMESELGE